MSKFYQKGTTIVEAMVTVLILSMGLVPVLSIILLANSLTNITEKNLIAANLAQEGLEVVRAMRDANWFDQIPFDEGLGDGVYRVEWNSTALLPESGNPVLKLDSTGLYNYSTGGDTSFRRRIFIDKDISFPGCDCELRVVAEVSWPEKGKTRTITVESHLYDWN